MSRRAGGWSNVRPKATDTNLIPEYDAVNDPWCPHTKQNKFQTHIKKVVGYQHRSQKPTGRLQSPGEYVGSPHRARGGQQRQRGHMVAMNQPPQRRLSAPVDDGMKPRKALPSLPGNRNNILGGRERRRRRKALFTMSRSSLLIGGFRGPTNQSSRNHKKPEAHSSRKLLRHRDRARTRQPWC